MDKKLHFISGLPRSGSTLLATLLQQNPRFHARMSSPVGGMYMALINSMSSSESTFFIDDEQRKAVLRGVFDNYYASTEADVIFDTNRAWCSKLPALAQLFPESKIICCVRDIAWVLDSFERMYQKNPLRRNKMFSDADGGTVYGRVDALAHRSRTVGFAWTALKEAFYGKWSASLLLVEYELLAAEPDQTMRLIYQFLDEPLYTHDFENFEYQETNFDENLGVPGLHDVHGPVKLVRRPTVLPDELFKKYRNMMFWQQRSNSRAHVIAVKRDNSTPQRDMADIDSPLDEPIDQMS